MKNKVYFSLLLLTLLFFSNSFSFAQENKEIEVNNPPALESFNSEVFENINVTPVVRGFRFSWNINYSRIQKLKDEKCSLTLFYIEESELKTNGKNDENIAWLKVKNIPIEKTQYTLEGLEGNKNYIFKIGAVSKEHIYWSEEQEVKTAELWGIFNFLVLIGALALFLYGMKIMSDGLQQAAGAKLRNFLGSMTSNPLKGVLTGAGITALIQSSSVTTVMTVSFVNAGILTLYQSAGVVMGANIGTTLTAWMIDIFGFKVDIAPYTLIILAVGLPLLFMSSSKLKGWANAIIGLALLFMGLGFLKSAVPELGPESGVVQFFVSLNELPFSVLIFVVFGTILTIIIQSSSATIALTMTLIMGGIIPFEAGAAMVLGENIGTAVTAEVASAVGNVYAKRTARIHTAFNIVGVTWALIVFPYLLKLTAYITQYMTGGNPLENPYDYGSTGLAVLHTSFNLINVLILIWFVPTLVRLAEKTVKSKGEQDEQFKLDYIGNKNFVNPSVSVLEVKKEIAKFGELTSRMSGFARTLLFEKNKKQRKELIAKLRKYEEITDQVEVEVINYLSHLSMGNIDNDLAVRIRGMNRIVINLERIGDIYYQIAKTLEKKNEDKTSFTAKQEGRLIELFDLVDAGFEIMIRNLNSHHEDVTMTEAMELEERINQKRDEIRQEYYVSLGMEEADNVNKGLHYSNMFAALERIGDHLINVTESVTGKV